MEGVSSVIRPKLVLTFSKSSEAVKTAPSARQTSSGRQMMLVGLKQSPAVSRQSFPIVRYLISSVLQVVISCIFTRLRKLRPVLFIYHNHFCQSSIRITFYRIKFPLVSKREIC
jgi:hypothetical protein